MARLLIMLWVVAVVFTGCSGRPLHKPLRIGAPYDPHMQVLATLYRNALRSQRIAVEEQIHIANNIAQLDAIEGGEVDLFPTTVQQLLSVILPRRWTDYPKFEATEFGDSNYTLLSHSLPNGVAVGDPVIGQQIVPVYRAAKFKRNYVKAVNKVTGELTLPELVQLAAKWQSGKDQTMLVDDWLSQHGLT